MKKFIICLCLFSAIKADAQNLVLNPSFEDTIACTGTYAMPCNYWYWATYGSPDYFSEQPDINCVVPAPQSTAGFQYARTGIAYVGLGVFTEHTISAFITKLSKQARIYCEQPDTLKQGHEYWCQLLCFG
ncbi:MAG: hypothetical protein KIS71_07085 [Bacteroidetes bacterium]|nr:hypothetical protein [Bacteroidota bacterium]